jgi:hypothetical protein
MKNISTARPRTLALLLAATALPVTPVVAQEAVAPPPVATTTPQLQADPRQAEPTAAPVAAPAAPVFAAPSEVVQALPARVTPTQVTVAKAVPYRAAITHAVIRPTRTYSLAAPVAVRPPTVPPVAAPAPAPVVVATKVPAPVVSPSVDASTKSTTVTNQSPWLWIIGGLVAMGVVALLFVRRRKPVEQEAYGEPHGVAPLKPALPLVASVAIVPVVKPAASSVKKSKAANLGVGDERPWIGISLQATGSNARGQTDLVEYNLIVENAGEVVARDVEVSTFLIDGRVKSSETETSLIDPVGETQSRFIDLAPGTSVPIASTLSVPHGTDPCIIAEARYPLPGGGEGHIAARFIIEATNGDTVEARLDNVLERV